MLVNDTCNSTRAASRGVVNITSNSPTLAAGLDKGCELALIGSTFSRMPSGKCFLRFRQRDYMSSSAT